MKAAVERAAARGPTLGAVVLACVASIACNQTPKVTADGPAGSASTAGAVASSSGGAGATSNDAATTAAKMAGSAAANEPLEGAGPRVVVATQDSDAISLIRTERLKAKAAGRVLVVYVSATWCEPCKRFKEELRSGRLDARLAKVTLLAFDADADIDRLGAAGYTFRFVPFVALPGADGRAADTVEATGKGGQAWRELLGKLDAWQKG